MVWASVMDVWWDRASVFAPAIWSEMEVLGRVCRRLSVLTLGCRAIQAGTLKESQGAYGQPTCFGSWGTKAFFLAGIAGESQGGICC